MLCAVLCCTCSKGLRWCWFSNDLVTDLRPKLVPPNRRSKPRSQTLLLTHGFVDGIPADSPMAEKVRMVVEEAEKAEKPATSQDVYDRQSTEV